MAESGNKKALGELSLHYLPHIHGVVTVEGAGHQGKDILLHYSKIIKEKQSMAFTKAHAQQNKRIFEEACILVENDNYDTARKRFKSGELVRELEKRFPDVSRKRLKRQAATAYMRRPR